MGTEVPKFAEESTFELPKITFTASFPDSCTTVALQTALLLGVKETYVVGYDGYKGEVLSEKEMELSNENKILFLIYYISIFLLHYPLSSITFG